MTKEQDAPLGHAVDPGRLDRNDRKLLLDQVVSPTDRNGRPLREEIRARLSRHAQTCYGAPFQVLFKLSCSLFHGIPRAFALSQGRCTVPHGGGAL